MHLEAYASGEALLAHGAAFLERAEPENNTLFSACRFAAPPEACFFAALKTGSASRPLAKTGPSIAGVAVWASPIRLLLSFPFPDEGIALLVDGLRGRGAAPQGMIGPEATAHAFVDRFLAGTGRAARLHARYGVQVLERVLAPPAIPGALREATEADVPLLGAWTTVFSIDAGDEGDDRIGPAAGLAMAARRIAAHELFVWEDAEGPRSMAAVAGHTARGVRVNYVYTPQELRGRGYAKACVGALSQRMLDLGKRYVTLNVDLANPASTAVYRRIGYRPLLDLAVFDFA